MVRARMMILRTLLPVPWCWRRARVDYAALWGKFGAVFADPPDATDLDPATGAALVWRARGSGWRDYASRLPVKLPPLSKRSSLNKLPKMLGETFS